MLFPTPEFAIFFAIVFVIAWDLRERFVARKLFLVAVSYVFYGWWDWRFCFLLAGSTLANWLFGLWLDGTHGPRARRWIVAGSVTVNLSVLAFFKYYVFFIENIDGLMRAFGQVPDLPYLHVALPVGISFFTFHGISYIVDVYREKVPAARSLVDLMLYMAFFPQLVAGPIVRASHFLPQLRFRPELDRTMVAHGLLLAVVGLFKKVVIANYLATLIVDDVFFDPAAYHPFDLAAAVYGYAVQIYCDFSGYTDTAIGVALLLGYQFPKNFDQPYRARSLQEFWRRWHISLSSFLRDYLYIPLGGSRHGPMRTNINLIVTMLLGGLWHGANWTFVLWGAIHGFGLAIERVIRSAMGKDAGAGGLIGLIITFHIVCAAWIPFRAESIELAFAFYQGFWTNWAITPAAATPGVVFLILLGLAFHALPTTIFARVAGVLERLPSPALGAVMSAAIVATFAVGPGVVTPFIYFQF